MKIVVIGGTGLIGSKLINKLRAHGHEAIAASPNSGVNSVTGEGLAEVLKSASVVVDVSNSPDWEDAAVLKFFETSTRNLPYAWLVFAGALALHVTDEATHNFLAFYNPFVTLLKTRVPLPFPTFTFKLWVVGLAAGIALLICLSPSAFRRARWLRIAAIPLAIVVGVLNASFHMLGSLYYGRFLPGVYSSPILLAAAVVLLAYARGAKPRAARAASG